MISTESLNKSVNENLCKVMDLDSYSIDFNDRTIEEEHSFNITALFGNNIVFSGSSIINSPRVSLSYKGKPYFFFPKISIIKTGNGVEYDNCKMEKEIIRLIKEIKETHNNN